MADVNFNVAGNNADLIKNVEQIRIVLQGIYSEYQQEGKKVMSLNEKISLSFKKVWKEINKTELLKSFISDVVKVRGEFQQLEVSFKTLLQSKGEADALMSQIMELAGTTPFSVTELGAGAKQLISYGLEVESVNDTLTQLGNIALGLGVPLEQLTTLYGNVMSQGSLSFSELEKLNSSGFSLLQELANTYGTTTESMNKMISAGEIGFPEIKKVINDLTNEGGKFYNLIEEQSETIVGKVNNLGDAWNIMLNKIGKSQGVAINGSLDIAKYMVENYEEVGRILMSLVATYGIYKAATISYYAITKTYGIYDIATKELQFAATMKNIAATKILSVQQGILNKAMLAGPFALMAAALVGVSYAIFKVATAETELERAHNRLGEANSDVEKSVASEISKLSSLERRLAETKKGTEEYEKIKKTIVDNYGQYYQGIDGEIDRIGNLSTVYTQLVENMRMSIGQRQFETFFKAEQDNLDKTISEKLDVAYNSLLDKYGQNKGTNLYKQFFDSAMRGEALSPSIIKDLENTTFWDVKWGSNAKDGLVDFRNNILGLRSEIAKEMKATENIIDEYKIKFRITDEDFANMLIGNTITKSTNVPKENKSLSQLITDIKNAGKSVSDLREQSKKGIINDDVLESAIKKVDALKESFKLKTGKDFDGQNEQINKTRTQQERLKEAALEAIKARKEAEINSELEYQQEMIDLKEEGEEKALAQIQLNYDKRYLEIQREERELLQKLQKEERALWEKDNPDWETNKRTFTPKITALPKENAKPIQAKYSNASIKKDQETKAYFESQKQTMNEFLAAYGDYMQKRQAIIDLAEAKKKGKSKVEQAIIEAETRQALSNLDIEAIKSTSAFGKLFSDMSTHSVKELRKIASEAEEALAFVKNGEWDPEKGKSLDMTEATFNVLKKTNADGADNGTLKTIEDGIKNVNREVDTCETSFNKMGKGFKKAFAAGADAKTVQEGLAEIEQGLNSAMQAGQFLSNALAGIGDAFGNDTMSGIADGIGVAMDAVGGAMDGAKAGAAFGPWGAAAGAAIGLVSSLSSSLAKIHDAKNEKRIQAMQEQVEGLEKSYDNLGEAIEKAYSTDASELIDQQNELLEQQKILIQGQIAEEKNKKKSDNGRIEEWQNQLESIDKQIGENKEKQLDAIMGSDLKSAIDEFAQAYADAWSAGNDRAKSSKDLVKDMIKQMIMESLKAASSKPMEELRKKLADYYSDGIISTWEREQIEKDAEAITKELDSKYGWADEYLKGEEESTSQADSSKGGFESMSQETGSELNGRFTALQISNEEIKNSMLLVLGNLSSLCTTASDGNILLTEMRNLAVMSNGHLEDIAKHTKVLLGFGDKLDRIEQNTGRL